jgi:PAS domain S-box-containing protein
MASATDQTAAEALPISRSASRGATVSRLETSQTRFREREVRYRELLNALPAAVYTTDAAGRITFYNEAAVALAGRRPVLGTDEWCVTWRLFRPDGSPLPHNECPMAMALKEGRAVRGVEAIAERPDGSRIWFAPYPTPLRDETGAVVGAVNMLVDITHRKQAEERQTLLSNEVNHRANNILAVVQAALRLTRASTVEEFRCAMEGRIGALAHAHNLLAQSRWTGADLRRLIGEELKPYLGGDRPRAMISGESTPLTPTTAQCLAMIVHELVTNAAKYGALSSPAGRVRVEWVASARRRLVLQWIETDGPAAGVPARTGIGTKVIRAAVSQLAGEVRFDWKATGLACEIQTPLPSDTDVRSALFSSAAS